MLLQALEEERLRFDQVTGPSTSGAQPRERVGCHVRIAVLSGERARLFQHRGGMLQIELPVRQLPQREHGLQAHAAR